MADVESAGQGMMKGYYDGAGSSCLAMQLEGKVAIVTGGGRGIGRAIAEAYASEGAKVTITARTESELDSVAANIHRHKGKALPLPGDATNPSEVQKVVKSTLDEFGKIDILVNNAGVGGPTGELDEISEKEWDAVLGVNLKGAILFTKLVLPGMLQRGSGNIINVSSGAGEKRPRRFVRSIPYTVSKFAIEGFTSALSVRLLGTGVNVNALKPGTTRTALYASIPQRVARQLTAEVGEPAEPESVNKLAVYLASLKPGELNGESLDVRMWNKSHQG